MCVHTHTPNIWYLVLRSETKPLGNFKTSIRDGFPFQQCPAWAVDAYLAEAGIAKQFSRKNDALACMKTHK